MPKYLFQAHLNSDGVAGIIKEGGTSRVAAVNSAIEALGGTVEAFYFAFGEADSVLIADLPDNEAATAFALDVAGSGRVAVTTTVLVTPEEVDRAVAKRPGFRGPGA
ncbi:MAG TPA: GYD domain-containing protein [Acidimicrobiia bacterium]|nr:GYD domain-containing protein [Acidimicrobiia bacterium]